MVAIATWSFWLLLATVLYVYAGFPLLVVVVGKLRHRRVKQQPITPTISLIIAAYNEERDIAKRLENALALEYPSNALEIIVASDGSTDATASIVATYVPHGVRLLSLPRRGKIHALNDAVAQATGELLVFSDANTFFERRALRSLAQNFADPEVGGVAGNKVYTVRPGSESSSQGEALYWAYDKWLKQMESLTGNIVSADGAIYAIRHALYRPLSDLAVTDDFAISTAVVEQGYRLVFESEAYAYEVAIPSADREFQRKVRLMTRGIRGLILRRRLLNPFRYGFYALLLLSHKLLCRFVPVLLLLMFPACILASPHGPLYLGATLAQACFYGLACVGYVFRRTCVGKQKCFYVPFFYCLANTAALIAIIKLVHGEHIQLWQPQRHNVEA